MPNTVPLINELRKILGAKNVLTALEHIYVYSRSKGFGIQEQPQPVAVLRNVTDIDTVRMLAENYGIGVEQNEKENQGTKPPYLLIDKTIPVSIEKLENTLTELESKHKTQREEMKKAHSFPHWATLYLQSSDGFQLSKTGDDKSFCVVQSYFDDIQTYSSKGRLLLAKALLGGQLEASSTLVDSIYSCTACGQCYDQLSLGSLEINNAINKARNHIAEKNMEPSVYQMAHRNIRLNGNPMGLPVEDRIMWFEETIENHPFQENPVLYWPGCVTSYRLPELVESTCKILEETDQDFGLLGSSERCCGLILYLAGYWEKARGKAEKTIESLGSVEQLVTNCAGCYYTFSRLYPSLGVDTPFQVLHSSQFIKQQLLQGKLSLGAYSGRYTWHDPCDLGRHCRVYEPPRYVLASVPELEHVESTLNQEHTVCCGAGGGLWMYNEEITKHVSHKKIVEALPQGIDGVVTGCPTCIISMRNTLRNSSPGVKVLDLVELVAACI